MLISYDKKFSDIPMSVVPLERDVDTGFECVKDMLESGEFHLTDDTLVVCYVRSYVGKEFTTAYFQNTLNPLPNRQFSGFTITLSERALKRLYEIALFDDSKEENILDALEKLWKKQNFSERIKVEFMDSHSEFGTVIPIHILCSSLKNSRRST